ncbi:MAG: hypothetical protein M0004_12320 [Actinomycetota bacterium]|nr:hypothetical protein [Actinomycetota bacterium]
MARTAGDVPAVHEQVDGREGEAVGDAAAPSGRVHLGAEVDLGRDRADLAREHAPPRRRIALERIAGLVVGLPVRLVACQQGDAAGGRLADMAEDVKGARSRAGGWR